MSRGSQLPTIAQAKLLIEANLITKCNHRNSGARWDCAVKVDGRVCRNSHNGTRTQTKDSRNMADHIYRHHRAVPAVLAVVAVANTLHVAASRS